MLVLVVGMLVVGLLLMAGLLVAGSGIGLKMIPMITSSIVSKSEWRV